MFLKGTLCKVTAFAYAHMSNLLEVSQSLISRLFCIRAFSWRKKLRRDIYQKKQDTNKRYIKNLLEVELTQAQINLLSMGLKFIPTPLTNESHIRTQILNDFKAFANIFMAKVETDVINQSTNIPVIWKRYSDDIFSLWNTNKEAINNFTELANRFHPSIKFTAEISHTEITFMETCVYKGDRLKKNSSLDVRTHFKPTETFQYTPCDSCHPRGVRKGFIKGEALRLLRINS